MNFAAPPSMSAWAAIPLFAAAILFCEIGLAADGDPCDLVADSGAGDGRIVNNLCFPISAVEDADKCENAGWSVSTLNLFGIKSLSCRLLIRDHASPESARDAGDCTIHISSTSVNVVYPCADAFGAGLQFPENDGGENRRFVFNCPDTESEFMVPDPSYGSGGQGGAQSCVSADAPGVCASLFGGAPPSMTTPASAELCSGIDINDTFCIVGSPAALPCRGLFRHVWACNQLGRKALDPWHCAEKCPSNARAQGAKCVPYSDD